MTMQVFIRQPALGICWGRESSGFWSGHRRVRTLNPIENLWGIMARQVYAHGRQYNTLSELKSAVISAWNKLSLVTLRNMISSMKNRIFEVILNRGGITKY